MTKEPEDEGGERLFREYLDAHGYVYERPDRDDGREGRAADFRLSKAGSPVAIVEVKQWDEFDSPYRAEGVGVVDPRRLYAPIRNSVRSAAGQLKAHQQEGLPLVVVLVNHKGFPIALDDDDVRFALSGNPTFTAKVDPEAGGLVDGEFIFGRDGRLRPQTGQDPGQHVYVSAVVILRQRDYETDWSDRRRMIGFGPPARSIAEAAAQAIPYMEARAREMARSPIPSGGYNGLDVFETYSVLTGEAVPLPDDLFDAPGDRRLGFTLDGVPILRRGRNVPRLFAEAEG
jgi:hypothetical protein